MEYLAERQMLCLTAAHFQTLLLESTVPICSGNIASTQRAVRRTFFHAATAAPVMVGRLAAVHIMVVLMTSSGVVAAAAKAPDTAPMQKSSCGVTNQATLAI